MCPFHFCDKIRGSQFIRKNSLFKEIAGFIDLVEDDHENNKKDYSFKITDNRTASPAPIFEVFSIQDRKPLRLKSNEIQQKVNTMAIFLFKGNVEQQQKITRYFQKKILPKVYKFENCFNKQRAKKSACSHMPDTAQSFLD